MSFKRAKVVMLPTNEKAHYGDIILTPTNPQKLLIFQHQNCTEFKQHLYIISDEEIKEDDYSVGDEGVFGPYEKGDILPSNSKRIIATTDTSLGLPQPSQQFIEKYIKEYNLRNIIANVLVEYLEGHIDIHSQITPLDCKVDYFNEYGQYGGLKVNKKDNTITIKKVKESWSKEEIIELFAKYEEDVYRKYKANITNISTKNWIEQNL